MGSNWNLVERPWIPVCHTDGSTGLVGLHDAFAGAHGVGAVADSDVLNTAAIRRLLLAIAYEALGCPADYPAQAAAGIDGPAVATWLAANAGRFDLFGPAAFAQNPAMAAVADPAAVGPATALLFDAAGRGAVFTDFRHARSGLVVDEARAARAVLALHTFSPGGLQPFPTAPLGAVARTAKSAVSAKRMTAWAQGSDLAVSLGLNLVPVPAGSMNYTWADPHLCRTIGRHRAASGAGDALTWLSRSVLLVRSDHGAGVDRVMLCEGERFDPVGDGKASTDAAVLAHTLFDADGVAVLPSQSRRPWRHWALAAGSTSGLLGHLAALPEPVRAGVRIEVAGMASYQSRIDGPVHGSWPLAPALDPEVAVLLGEGVAEARKRMLARVRALAREIAVVDAARDGVLETLKSTAMGRFNAGLTEAAEGLLSGFFDAQEFRRRLGIAGDVAVQAAAAQIGAGRPLLLAAAAGAGR